MNDSLFTQRPYAVFAGDACEILPRLAAEDMLFDCVVTSPPYFNQREYGDDGRELGQEEKIEEFVAALVAVFGMVPLQPWGSIWVNIGDKRGSNGELLCVPEAFLAGMQAAGWKLIDKVVWAKEVVATNGRMPEDAEGHAMVEPAPGRLNGNCWEPIYRFVRDKKKSWTDMCAVSIPRKDGHFLDKATKLPIEQSRYLSPELMECETSLEGRRLGNVWNIAPPTGGKKHHASYPVALVERCIAMTAPEFVTDEGPRERIVELVEYDESMAGKNRIFGQYSQYATPEELAQRSGRMDGGRHYTPKYPKTVGWTKSELPARPGIVLDMFGGTGTTGEVAIKFGRRFVGIDLYPEIAQRMEQRCEETYKFCQENWQNSVSPPEENNTNASSAAASPESLFQV